MLCKTILLGAVVTLFCLNYAFAFTVVDLFNDFIRRYNRRYDPSNPNYHKRLAVFKESLRRAQWLNKQRTHKASAYYGVTEFSDLTPREFHDFVIKKWWSKGNKKHRKLQKRDAEDVRNITDVPKRVDWRELKVVTSVKNQKKCGACWAFSTVETIETMNALKQHKLQELSVQQMIDCAENGNYGCNGGDTCSAFMWMSKKNVSIVTEREYPYIDTTGKCSVKSSAGVRIASNFTCDNYTHEEGEIVRILAQHGPATAAVDATGWQDYLGGIIQFHCETDRNHAVQIVGYDISGDVPYYIVRNSWGKTFGIDGYLHIAIGTNVCGIAQDISYISVL